MHFSAAIRLYSIACTLLVWAMFPRFVASYGEVRQQPAAITDEVEALSFDGGEWLPSRGLAVARVIAGLPAGMTVCYRSANGGVSCGPVRNVPEAPTRTVARTVTAALALAFVLAGVVMAVVAVDRRAIAAAGMLAGTGLLFGADFLEPTLAAIRDLDVQLVVIGVWEWFPRYLGLLCMLDFACQFPTTLPRTRSTRALIATVTTLVVTSTLLNGISHVPGLLDGLSLRGQSMVIALVILIQQLVYAGAAFGVIVLAARQRRRVASQPSQQRRRAGMVAAAILVGFAPSMTLGIVHVAAHIAFGIGLVPFPLLAASFLTLLAVPAAVMTAVMAKRVDSIRIVARRAALFAIAGRVFLLLKLLPVFAIAALLYDKSIAAAIERRPIAFAVSIAAAIALFGFGERMRRAVSAYFSRDDDAARERLASIPLLVSRAEDVEAVLEREISAALNPEAVTLHEDVPPGIAMIRDVTLASSLRGLDEIDRHWIAVTRAELLVPVIASGEVLGVLAIGEKASELPFDDAEKSLLRAAASAAALTIENRRLRGRAPAIATRLDDEAALFCPLCHRYESQSVAARCPVDDSELQPASVPYVFAGKYRIEQRLGAGAMGVVYRGRDLELERDVAIKTLPHVSTETAARLRREARTAANLQHPHLATVFAVESWRGVPMLILEYLDDGTLAERVARGPMPIDRIVRCGAAIADALAHVHARDVLHRDVKPSNIGFSRAAGAKLLDFGLAHATNGIAGTPGYLSPEAIVGEPLHPDFDVWALSVTLYEAVTGAHPFAASTATATMNAVLSKGVADPRDVRGDCPAALARLLLDALSRRRELRPRSAIEFASRLRA